MITMNLERRPPPSRVWRLLVPLLAMALALVVGGIFLAAGGHDPFAAYRAMWDASFGSTYGIESIVIKMTPLIFTGLAVAIALQMGLWNIGGEGQFIIGATAATGVGLFVHGLAGPFLLALMMVAAALGGALWGLIAAIPRALFGLNEMITTLFLNYIAALLLKALVFGPWGDPAAFGFAYSRALPAHTALPEIGSTGVNAGIFVAIAIAMVVSWLIRRTPWGFGVRIAGGNPDAARYLGLPVKRRIVLVLALSAALAGLGGGLQLTGVTMRLQEGITSNAGYTGLLIAVLAKGRPILIVVSAMLFAALAVGALALQTTGVASAISTMLQALIIVFLLAGESAVRYRVRIVRGSVPPAAPEQAKELTA